MRAASRLGVVAQRQGGELAVEGGGEGGGLGQQLVGVRVLAGGGAAQPVPGAALGDRGRRGGGERLEVARRGLRLVQQAQRDEAGEEVGVERLARRDRPGIVHQRVGVGGIGRGAGGGPPCSRRRASRSRSGQKPENAVRGEAAAGPRHRGRATARRRRDALGAAQPARLGQHQPGIVGQRARHRGEQRGGVGVVVLQRQARGGQRAVRRVEQRKVARGGRRVGPGQRLEPLPLVGWGQHGAPALREVGGVVGEAGDPGAARLGRGLRVAAGVGQRVGAAQPRGGQGDRVGGRDGDRGGGRAGGRAGAVPACWLARALGRTGASTAASSGSAAIASWRRRSSSACAGQSGLLATKAAISCAVAAPGASRR